MSAGCEAEGTTFTNPPNQNDSDLVATGRVAAMKYDLAAAGKTLGLALDGSYVVQDGSTILEPGSYSMAYAGSNVYTLTATTTLSWRSLRISPIRAIPTRWRETRSPA